MMIVASEIPLVVLCNVVSYLPPENVLAVALTCHAWAAICDHEELWMFFCETYGLTGTEETDPPAVPESTGTQQPYKRCFLDNYVFRFDSAHCGRNLQFSNNNRTVKAVTDNFWRAIRTRFPRTRGVFTWSVHIDKFMQHWDAYVGVCTDQFANWNDYADNGNDHWCYKPIGYVYRGDGNAMPTPHQCSDNATIVARLDCDKRVFQVFPPGALVPEEVHLPLGCTAFYPAVWLYWEGVQVTIGPATATAASTTRGVPTAAM
eukprot:TRINITY_DN13456_c0_g2_i1.p2 TRINITY_DN13456_c0_g2~~TRINITY_DN13456_c0_g2_i1.p2  ORF type:complete len:261 (+),score=41.06 TRINITY_DN13456_c0_g2_i1:56-838(+)